MPEKSFSLIALPVLPEGVTKDFQNFLSTIVNNFIEIQPNFNTKCNWWYKFGGIQSRRRLFLNGLMSAAKRKKFGQLLESCISGTARLIPFKFDT